MSLSPKNSVGSRDQRILIQSPVIVNGSANSDIIDSWEDFCNPWACVTDGVKHGFEQYEAERLTAEQTTVFNIRYRTDLDPKLNREALKKRIVWGSIAYRIVGITTDTRKVELDIKAEMVDEALT